MQTTDDLELCAALGLGLVLLRRTLRMRDLSRQLRQ